MFFSYLQHLIMPNAIMPMNLGTDFRIILVCNAYSTNQEYFTRPMNLLVEALAGNAKTATGAPVQPVPYSMVVLDSLTVHSKMSLIHGWVSQNKQIQTNFKNIPFRFVSQMIKHAQCKTSVPTPALIETYARLLVYTEIESLGIKGFLSE